MKTLGLIGGTTWVSTVEYYKYINQLTHNRLGGSESARLVMYSVNFAEFMHFVHKDDWNSAAELFTAAAQTVQAAGAEALVLCANTVHLMADAIQINISIPILHIVDAVAAEIRKANIDKVALLGTRYTMEKDFFKQKLLSHGITSAIPESADREFINHSIYEELGKEIYNDETRLRYLKIIEKLSAEGCGGVILGCTEIPLLIKQRDCPIPVFDTTFIHAKYAVDFALQ